jgi:teichoic acid transport system permease protein
MRAIRFPRALLPVSVVISRLLTFTFQLAVIAVVALGTGEGVSRRWLALPLVLLVHTALNLGGAFTAARLNDSFRDVEQIIPFFFRLLIFISGVMFPIQNRLAGANVPRVVSAIISLNPLVPMINMYRWVFLGNPMTPGGVAYAVLASATLLAFGFWFFRAAELRYGRA